MRVYSGLLIVFLCQFVHGLDIYVSRKDAQNSTCWKEGESFHCKTLSSALEELSLHNDSTVWMDKGVYDLFPMKEDDTEIGYRFVWMSNITISVRGVSQAVLDPNTIPASVICGKKTGLSFIYVANITIRGIQFIRCGAYQYSTSRLSSNSPFQQFYTALYFLYCSHVTLEFVHVMETPGTGVVIYATVGDNIITNCSFSFNSPNKTAESGGGGLYIEFPYCIPDPFGILNCTSDPTSLRHYVSDSKYAIVSCKFHNNTARISNEDQFAFIIPQLDKHLAFGRGGGLSIFFKGYSSGNSIDVRNCHFTNNVALWGGGLFIEFQDMSNNNNFSMKASFIKNNYCFHHDSDSSGTGGGGARLGFIFFNHTHVCHNHMTFSDVIFSHNKAYFGGGLSLYSAKEPTEVSATNTLELINCNWTSNLARVGSGVDLSVWHPIPYGAIIEPIFNGCSFSNNTMQDTSKLNSIGAFYSDFIPVSFYETIEFLSNTETALVCLGARLRFHSGCEAHFSNNSGLNGGAVALFGYSFLEVAVNTTLHFVQNRAEVRGGAIFGETVGERDFISSRNCFIRYNDIEAHPEEWNTTFYYERNEAKSEANSIYATSLISCLWGSASGPIVAADAAKSVFCWNSNHTENKRWTYANSSCEKQIATSPAKYVAKECTSDDCTGSDFSISVIPGLSTILPFYTIDDTDNNVTNGTVLTARINNDRNIYIDQTSFYISDNSIKLYGNPNDSTVVTLATIPPRVISTQVRVKLLDCPPGMIISKRDSRPECVCGGDYSGLIHCHSAKFYTELQRGAWIGVLRIGNSSVYVAGDCPYCSLFTNNRTLTLPQNASNLRNALCNSINRTGDLCGKCLNGYGPFVNGFEVKCQPCPSSRASYNWIFYLMTEFLPVTIFFFVVVLFNISATSGPANAFVFFAQTLTSVFKINGDGSISLSRLARASGGLSASYQIPYDIWNQNFFHPFLPKFCLSSKVSTLQVFSTGYITALYPLLLVVIFSGFVWSYGRGFKPVVCLCRPIHICFARLHRVWNLQRSIVHALATFIILSYTKFTQVSFFLLNQSSLVDDAGDLKKRVLYYDGTIEYLGTEHIPYVIASVIAMATFVAIPPIMLITPSLMLGVQKLALKVFKKKIVDFRFSPGAGFSQFLNAFYGCYKDGTGGSSDNTIDCRWFAGFYFILRLLLFVAFAFTSTRFFQYVIQQLICIMALLLFVIFRPYKNWIFNIVDVCMFANLAAISTLTMYNYHLTTTESEPFLWSFVVQYVLVFLPLLYITIYVIYLLWRKYCKVVCKKECVLTETEQNSHFMEYADEGERYRNIGGSYQKRVLEKKLQGV